MSHTIDETSVQTDAGTYTVRFEYDEYSDAPYDDGRRMAFDSDRIDVAEGEHSDEVLSIIRDNGDGWDDGGRAKYRYSSAGIARWLRLKYGVHGVRAIDYDYRTSAPTTDREHIYGIAWAPDDVPQSHGEYDDYPSHYTDISVAEFRAWASGDCFGYVVVGPDGREVDSCWGFYGYWDDALDTAWVMEQARESIDDDVIERRTAASLVGAGIVGLI